MIRPSALPALEKCPRFANTEGNLQAAERGTEMHAQLMAQLTGKECDIPLTEEEWTEVDWATKTIQNYFGQAEVITEHHCTLTDLETFETITEGTADIWVPAMGAVIDYKSGNQRDYGAQIQAYGAALAQEEGLSDFTAVVVYSRSRKVVVDTVRVEDAIDRVKKIIDDAYKSAASPCEFCSFCQLQAKCPALLKMAAEPVIDFDEKDPGSVARNIERAKILSEWSEAYLAASKEAIIKGLKVPGWVVKQRAGARKISNPRRTVVLSEMTPEQAYEYCKFTITDLKDILKAKTGLKGKDLDKAVENQFGEVIVTSPNVNYLTKE
jgi:CRISPR/Cas system-associated exonuclease Cas4 (RecB family)